MVESGCGVVAIEEMLHMHELVSDRRSQTIYQVIKAALIQSAMP